MDNITDAFLSFKEGLAKIVRKVVEEPVEIEDIVHEAYIRSLEAGKLKEIQSPKAFLARTARNLALNHISRSAYKLNTTLEENKLTSVYTDEPNLVDDIDTDRKFSQLCLAVENLPIKCRKVFILKHVYGLTQKEIAKRLGISEKTVENHLVKALFKCRLSLRPKESHLATKSSLSDRNSNRSNCQRK